MSSKFSWILRGARRVPSALAILAVLSLATPSASAAITLSYTVDGGASTGLTDSVSATGTGGVGVGTNGIAYSITTSATDMTSGSSLATTTIDINNAGLGTQTITFAVTGTGFTLGGTAATGNTIQANYSVSGTGGPFVFAVDSVAASATAAGTPLGASVGTVGSLLNPSGSLSTGYTFTLGTSPTATILLSGSSFALSQTLAITLGVGDKATIGIITNAIPVVTVASVPEPSSMALAGLGTLGLIGYGLRRKARGA